MARQLDCKIVGSALECIGDDIFSGVQCSPDSTCALTQCTGDNSLRVYETGFQGSSEGAGAEGGCSSPLPRSLSPAVESREGSSIYDYCWYPKMNSADPASCVFLSSSRDHPLHLWDAYNGKLRASYVARDRNDQPEAATCCHFDPTGDFIYAGYYNAIRVFRTGLPGDDCELRRTVAAKKRKDGQKG